MDYAEMYYTLFQATENAIHLLIDAQQKCEELYIINEDSSPSEESKKDAP